MVQDMEFLKTTHRKRFAASLAGALTLAAVTTVVAGTAAARDIILRPLNNPVLTEAPRIVLKAGGEYGTPGVDYQVYLNGVDIDEMATRLLATQYIIQGYQIAGLVRPGSNEIRVERDLPNVPVIFRTEIERFQYDAGGPAISIRGVETIGGGQVAVTGRVTDPAGVAALWLNDEAASINPRGEFSVEVPATGIYAILAADNNGSVTEKLYLNNADRVPGSVKATISNEGLGPVGELISEMVVESRSDLVAYVLDRNPIYKGKPGGLAGDVTLDATGLLFDDPYVGLTSNDGTLVLSGSIPNVVVPLDGFSRQCLLFFCFNLPVNGTVYVELANVASDVTIGVNGRNKINLDLLGFRTELGEFRFESNWDGVPIISGIIQSAVNKVLADALGAALEVPLEMVLNESFAGLNTSIAGSILEVDVDLEAIPENLYPIVDGLVLEAGLEARIGDPIGASNLGYLLNDVSVPVPGSDSHLTAGLSGDVFNQLFWQGQQAGMLDLQLCGDISSLIEEFNVNPAIYDSLPPLTEEIFRNGGFRIETRAVAAPEIRVPGNAGAQLGLNADAIKVRVTLDSRNIEPDSQEIFGFEPGVKQVAVEAFAGLDIGASLTIPSEGRLGIDLIGTPAVTLDLTRVEKFDEEGNLVRVVTDRSGLDNQANWYNFLVNYVIPTLTPVLEASFGEIPLPTLAGFSLNITGFSVGEDNVITATGSLARDGGPDQGLVIPMPAVLAQYQNCP